MATQHQFSFLQHFFPPNSIPFVMEKRWKWSNSEAKRFISKTQRPLTNGCHQKGERADRGRFKEKKKKSWINYQDKSSSMYLINDLWTWGDAGWFRRWSTKMQRESSPKVRQRSFDQLWIAVYPVITNFVLFCAASTTAPLLALLPNSCLQCVSSSLIPSLFFPYLYCGENFIRQ